MRQRGSRRAVALLDDSADLALVDHYVCQWLVAEPSVDGHMGALVSSLPEPTQRTPARAARWIDLVLALGARTADMHRLARPRSAGD